MSATFAIHEASSDVTPIRRQNAVAAPVLGALKVVHPYYDFGPLLSHHCLFNIVIGARGRGKSYGAKRHAIRKNIRRGELFIVLRRYKEELGFRDSWFLDIQHEFPEWDFENRGNTFLKSPASQRGVKKRDWEVIGYAMALSTAAKQKSIPFPKVTLIIFEEFLIEKGAVRYLADEVKALMDLFSTVDRWQDKTTVLMLANSIMVDNPYFAHWHIDPDEREFQKTMGGELLVHIDRNENFSESVLNTRFGRVISGTAYGDFAANNVFKDENLDLIGEKTANAKHYFNLETRVGSFAIWQDADLNMYYATARMPQGQLHLTLLPDRLTEQKTLVFDKDLIIKQILAAFRNKRLYCDTRGTRALFLDLFRNTR